MNDTTLGRTCKLSGVRGIPRRAYPATRGVWALFLALAGLVFWGDPLLGHDDQAAGVNHGHGGPQAGGGSGGEPVYPDEGWIWVFWVPGTDRVDQVLRHTREIAAGQGFRVLDFDLTQPGYRRALGGVQLARGLSWMGDVELFAGERHVVGAQAILRFLEGWVAGTESLQNPRPPAVPQAPGFAPTPVEPAPESQVPPGTSPVVPVVSTARPVEPVLLPPPAAARPKVPGWRRFLGAHRYTALSVLAGGLMLAAMFLLRRRS